MEVAEINWLDKAILAVAEFGNEQVTRYDVYPIKVAMAVSLGLNVIAGIPWLDQLGMPAPCQLPFSDWVVVSFTFIICYVPIYLFSCSTEKIVSYEFSSNERWIYRILGWVLIGSWVLHVIWPAPSLLNG